MKTLCLTSLAFLLLAGCAVDHPYTPTTKNTRAETPASTPAPAPVTSTPTTTDTSTHQPLEVQGLQIDNLKQARPDEQNLFHELARANRTDLVSDRIAAHKIDGIAKPDQLGRLPLHYAHSREMTALLWNYSAQIAISPRRKTTIAAWLYKDKNGQTPLHAMSARGAAAAVDYSVEKFCRGPDSLADWVWGNELNAADNAGRTPLALALQNGDLVTVDRLLSCASTEIDSVDKNQHSLLHFAASLPSFEVGYALLMTARQRQLKLNLDTQDGGGESPLQVARRCANSQAEQLLLQYGANSVMGETSDHSLRVIASDPSIHLKCTLPARAN